MEAEEGAHDVLTHGRSMGSEKKEAKKNIFIYSSTTTERKKKRKYIKEKTKERGRGSAVRWSGLALSLVVWFVVGSFLFLLCGRLLLLCWLRLEWLEGDAELSAATGASGD